MLLQLVSVRLPMKKQGVQNSCFVSVWDSTGLTGKSTFEV